jgi:2-polyprenyl-3-methyl-5-hydroxy-6-metoxy-1,4-benzoquinol methylase
MSEHPENLLVRSWEANADAWTTAIRTARVESRRVATDAAIVAAVLATQPQRVLDVGCGEGWLVRALAGHGIAALGIDGSALLIAHARELGGSFRVLCYDQIVADPAALNGPFTTIVCNFALLGADITLLLAALRTALTDNGRIIIQTVHPFTACGDEPYRDGWRTETFAAFGDEFRAPMPWFFRTVGSWIAALAAAGLVLDRCDEPLHPHSGRPLSLLLTCCAAPNRSEATP